MVNRICIMAAFVLGSGVGMISSRLFGMMEYDSPSRPMPQQDIHTTSLPTEATVSSKPVNCYEEYLPDWVRGNPEGMAEEFRVGCKELSDKYDDGHRFFYAYQPYLAKIVLDKLETAYGDTTDCSSIEKPKFKFFEIGLGCHFREGGIKGGTPGGSALGWSAVFSKMAPVLDFDLHIMEYDAQCALNWHKNHSDICQIHTGDASSEADMARIVQETGSSHDFDVIIDDASHINWHMIKTLEIMMPQIQMGGIYVVEDIWSSCNSWGANFGTKRGEATGGTKGCMTTQKGNSTFFAKLVDWQRTLLTKKVPFPDVNHIDFHGQIVVLEKGKPQNLNKWKTKSS